MSIINTGNSEHYNWGINSEGWHLLKTDRLSVIEENVPPNEKEQRHYHRESQQFFYILSGVAHLEISGEVHEIEPGSGVHVPAGVPHQLMNNGMDSLRFLLISQPESHGDRIDV